MRKAISFLLCIIMTLSVLTVTSFAASESDYKAEFTVSASKTVSIAKGDTVTVSVSLKTNYGIYAVSLPVIYDATKFELQNTSSATPSSFLTFSGSLASACKTNGNFNSVEAMYSRCSNPDYWTQKSVMSQYKIAFATWAASATLSNTPVKLTNGEKIVSFKLKATKAVSAIGNNDIFISTDFLKTDSCMGGILYVGRCSGEKISDTKFVSHGQTVTAKCDFVTEVDINMNYKSKVDLYSYLNNFKNIKATSSDTSIVSVDGSQLNALKKGSATVNVTDESGKTAVVNVTVKYAWWQWLIKIVLFGWIWY